MYCKKFGVLEGSGGGKAFEPITRDSYLFELEAFVKGLPRLPSTTTPNSLTNNV